MTTDDRRPERELMSRPLQRLISGAGWLHDPGEAVEVTVEHADECAHWHGAPCNCEPCVRMVQGREGR